MHIGEPTKKMARRNPPGHHQANFGLMRLVAVAEEAQQELEHVHEIEIQVQSPHDRDLAKRFMTSEVEIFALDALGIIGRETSKERLGVADHYDGG